MKLNFKLLLLLSFVLSTTTTFSQESEEPKKKGFLNHLSVSPQLGKLYYLGDLRTDPVGSFFDGDENKLGYGFTLNYSLSDVLSISSGILNGQLRATNNEIKSSGASSNTGDFGLGIQFRTNIMELTFPRLDLNLSRLIFRDKSKFFNKLSIGVFASQGLMNFNTKVYALNQEDVNLLYYEDRGRTGDTWEAVTSYGSTLSYIVNDRFDIGLESSLKSVWNDKLDAWPSDGSSNDMISYTAITLTYHLKPRQYVKKLGEKPKDLLKEEELLEEEKVEDKLEELDEEVEEKPTEEKKFEEEKVEEKPVEQEEPQKEAEPKVKEVEERPKEAKKEEPKTETPTREVSLELYEGPGNFVSVAAFRNFKVAKIQAQKLIAKGETPIITKNRTGSWYIVATDRYDTLEEALPVMKQARKDGYSRAWVLVKPE
ncbi:MAG: SPOR domain-containing protein [Vicingaceae bacterium]